MNKKQDIQADHFYSLKELVIMHAFAWITHSDDLSNDTRSYRREIERDQSNKNMLKSIVRGTGRNTRYSFKGANVSKFVEAIESGTYTI